MYCTANEGVCNCSDCYYTRGDKEVCPTCEAIVGDGCGCDELKIELQDITQEQQRLSPLTKARYALLGIDKPYHLTLTYNPNEGLSIPDGKAMDIVLSGQGECTVTNWLVILAARVCIKNKTRLDITIKFKGEVIPIDEQGELKGEYPDGFGDCQLDLLMELI